MIIVNNQEGPTLISPISIRDNEDINTVFDCTDIDNTRDWK